MTELLCYDLDNIPVSHPGALPYWAFVAMVAPPSASPNLSCVFSQLIILISYSLNKLFDS